MIVKVIKTFRDRETKRIQKAGSNIDITEKRYNEIISKGKFVEPVADVKSLDQMTGKELEAFAKEIGIDVSKVKSKADKIAKIQKALSESKEQEAPEEEQEAPEEEQEAPEEKQEAPEEEQEAPEEQE